MSSTWTVTASTPAPPDAVAVTNSPQRAESPPVSPRTVVRGPGDTEQQQQQQLQRHGSRSRPFPAWEETLHEKRAEGRPDFITTDQEKELRLHMQRSRSQKSTAEKTITSMVVPHAVVMETPAAAVAATAEGTPMAFPPMLPPQRWNSSWTNCLRVMVTFFAFVLMGANEATYGALIPYIMPYYNLDHTVVSLVFLAPFFGYILAAVLNNIVHMKLGQRGVSIIGPGCHMICWLTLALHPPYPVLVVVCLLGGLGTGLIDAAWNAWLGNMANANELLGFLHGFFSLGATLGPLIATTLVTKAGLPWYTFYYIMLGGGVIELVATVSAFWSETGVKFTNQNRRESSVKSSIGRTREAVTNKVTWTIALFLLGYTGAEVALGGWIVSFMINVRHADPFSAGISVVGFWIGITLGRVTLGFITPRIGEKLAIAGYLVIGIALELLFWLIPSFSVSAAMVVLLGFFLGPIFPGAMVVAIKLLPLHLHVAAVGFAAAFGSGGASFFPFLVGAIANSKGVQVLQPVILALLVTILILWVCLPSIKKAQEVRDAERAAAMAAYIASSSHEPETTQNTPRNEYFV